MADGRIPTALATWEIESCGICHNKRLHFYCQWTARNFGKSICLKAGLKSERQAMIKIFWSKAALMLAIAGAVLSPRASRTYVQATDSSQTGKHRSPLACNALALSPAERTRHFNELLPALRSLKKGFRELDDGYEFEFSGDRATLHLLTEWAIQERECCPFFEITLRLEPGRGAAWLRLTGGQGAKAILKLGILAGLA
jgi:hypothetical protein